MTNELGRLVARQDEIRQAIAAETATIVAIKASRVYRLGQLIRRVFPKAAPPFPAPRTSVPGARGAADLFTEPSSEPLAEEIARAREELAALEAESARVHHELHHLRLSRPRRIWMAVRDRIALLRHPLWALAAAGRMIAHHGVGRAVRLAWRRFRVHELLLRFQPPESQETDQPHAADAIRWLPPARISGQTEHAFLMHPASSVTFRLRLPTGARVVADCALLPIMWADNHGGVTFGLEVESSEPQSLVRHEIRVNPGDRFVDRRWRPLALAVPAGLTGETGGTSAGKSLGKSTVRLTTRLPEGVSPVGAWAIWGEPRIEWPRPGAEMWRSIVVLATRLRQAGLTATLRHIRGVQASDEHTSLYHRWIQLYTPEREVLAQMATLGDALGFRPRISILTPVYNTDPRWLRACIDSVRAQVYPDWELCLVDDGSTSKATLAVLKECEGDARIRIVHLAKNSGISMASNAALELATGEFLAILDHDDELAPEALYEMVRVLNRAPDADFIYSDEDKLGAAGERCDPYFKPDWSPEHFRSCMYTCHLMVLRTSLVRELGGFRRGFDGSQDYDLVLRVVERTDRIHHVPQILYHWRKIAGSMASSGLAKTYAVDAGERALQDHVKRSGTDAVVLAGPAPGLFRLRHRIVGKPLVSLVLPTAGQTRTVMDRTIDLLVNCVSSVVNKTTYENYELIIGDDGELPEATAAYLESITSVPVRRVHFPHQADGFNYGRKLNYIAQHASGEHLVLFNDDTEVITPEWLEAMLEYSQQKAIGGVGAKLYFPDGRIQHIGMVIGVNGMAAHAFHGHQGSTPGYGASALIVRNYSAVTGACLMTRRELFEQLNGFETRFQFDFNDVDYCLRLRQLGYRLVYTPYAELYHLEWATWGGRPWHAEEVEYMRRAWAQVYEHDPYYNPNLTREHADFRVRG
jgi:GT2 family glycosyltransferase